MSLMLKRSNSRCLLICMHVYIRLETYKFLLSTNISCYMEIEYLNWNIGKLNPPKKRITIYFSYNTQISSINVKQDHLSKFASKYEFAIYILPTK